jgi:hypothetical protein
MRFDTFNNLLSLDAVTVLQQTLQDSAAVVLEDEFLILGSNQLKAFIDNSVLLFVCNFHLSLLDQKFVVINLL